MEITEWMSAGRLEGSGKIVDTKSHEKMQVTYHLEKRQLYLMPSFVPWKGRETRGNVDPAPPWPAEDKLVLELEDGQCVTCWLEDAQGRVKGNWPEPSPTRESATREEASPARRT